MTRTLHFAWEVPDELFDEQFREDTFLAQLKEDAAIKLFTAGRVSSGYAASLLGLTRRDFLVRVQQRGLPWVTYTEVDLVQDLHTLQALKDAPHDASQPRE